jgi:hypothetical protein
MSRDLLCWPGRIVVAGWLLLWSLRLFSMAYLRASDLPVSIFSNRPQGLVLNATKSLKAVSVNARHLQELRYANFEKLKRRPVWTRHSNGVLGPMLPRPPLCHSVPPR